MIMTFGMENCNTIKIPMGTSTKLDKDKVGKSVDVTQYGWLIGFLST